ncbi:hypothetical protein ACU6QD_02440 [Corynebacterium glucuronolyticum]|uniref:hypothetical protein n=1 Tax=Corynebacterium glucuronolyticum TaxID=39791 RepID=UPI00223B18BB|nr:hypothetical protein [Corynebacterium glucuronolyticum]MCT1441559.1 hypothetical protein [Corynebacterium glucuronolyticum]MCT1562947.1 hypothetical protein [Corynebacterium glucuronolyticum]
MKRAAVAVATSTAVAFASLAAPAMAQETISVNPGPPVAERNIPDPTDHNTNDDFLGNKSGLTSELEGVIAAIAALMGLAAIAGVATTAAGPIAGFNF